MSPLHPRCNDHTTGSLPAQVHRGRSHSDEPAGQSSFAIWGLGVGSKHVHGTHVVRGVMGGGLLWALLFVYADGLSI